MDEHKLLKRKSKAIKENNETLLLSVCTDLAALYSDEGRYDFAIEEYSKIAEIYKKQNKLLDFATAHRGIGEAYLGLRQFDKAVEHQKIHLGIARELNSKLEEQRALATIGHTYLTSYLEAPEECDKKNLDLAYKYFVKSSVICELLNGEISKLEWADMSARLYANLGLVQESLGNTDKALGLITKSINLCKVHDIYEQLLRGYLSLAALLEKRGDRKAALQQCNLAVETAKKLRDKPTLLSGALSNKAEILVRLGDFQGAKNALFKAYKLKTNDEEHEIIEKSLRIVATLNKNEEKILTTAESNFKELKQLYEKMGDACCELKCYDKAIDYYKKMLDAAVKGGSPPSELATCYYSLGETYRDNNEFEEALKYYELELDLCKNSLKDRLNTVCRIIDTKEAKGDTVTEILSVYKKALENCRVENNIQEEGRMLKHCISFLRRKNKHSEAFDYEQKLKSLNYNSSDSDSENSEPMQTTNIGDDINIEDITDPSDDSDTEQISRAKRRPKTFIVKRNVKGETQLHTACINGKLNVVRHLLDQGHPVNVRDHCGWLPLHEACIWGHLEIVQVLLEKGAAINDRGGVHCSGITPIHDAASNGHLRIVQFLLDKGANAVVKTDDGETVLDFLQTWRASNQIDQESEELYQNIVGRISSALNKTGYSPKKSISPKESQKLKKTKSKYDLDDSPPHKMTAIPDKRRSHNIGLDEDDDYVVEKTPEKSNFKKKDLRRSNSIGIDDASTSKNAANDYRNVMESIRHNNRSLSLKKNVGKRSALISADDVDDDWLEDDMGKKAKKRKTSSPTKSDRSRRSSEISEFAENQIQLSDDEMATLPEDDPIIGLDSSSLGSFHSFSSKMPSPKKNHHKPTSQKLSIQPRLPNFCLKRNLVEADSTSSTKSRSPLKPLSRNQSIEISAPIIEPTVHVDVKIIGKLYRVPVLLSQVNVKTIKWLAEEAANRYAKKEYIKPILELETENGAVLANDDLISSLFSMGTTQAEPVEGRVIKWNIPPLIDRFKEACNDLETEPQEKICKELQELTISLNLSNKALRGNMVAPLCKALNKQSTLLELDLSQNFLTIECFQLLSNSLPTLENLYRLNLNCTGLTSELLNILSNGFTNNCKITNLDLSDNYLEDDCFPVLAKISDNAKLKIFYLSYNNLSKDLIRRSYNKDVKLNLSSVEELNISDNHLSKESVIKLVSWLEPSNLTLLDLSRNAVEQGLLGEMLVVFMENASKSLALRTLKMSGCEVQDSELVNLLKIINNMEYLDISYNDGITAISLQKLLESDCIENINLIGCNNITKYYDANFILGQKYKSIKLTLDNESNNLEYEHLNNLWKEKYGTNGRIEKHSQYLFLFVI